MVSTMIQECRLTCHRYLGGYEQGSCEFAKEKSSERETSYLKAGAEEETIWQNMQRFTTYSRRVVTNLPVIYCSTSWSSHKVSVRLQQQSSRQWDTCGDNQGAVTRIYRQQEGSGIVDAVGEVAEVSRQLLLENYRSSADRQETPSFLTYQWCVCALGVMRMMTYIYWKWRRI